MLCPNNKKKLHIDWIGTRATVDLIRICLTLDLCCLLGVRAETSSRTAGAQGYENEGLRGLKALGVRELSYKLAFLACHVAPTNPRVRYSHMKPRW